MITIEIPEELLETYDSDKITRCIIAREKFKQVYSLMEYYKKKKGKGK